MTERICLVRFSVSDVIRPYIRPGPRERGSKRVLEYARSCHAVRAAWLDAMRRPHWPHQYHGPYWLALTARLPVTKAGKPSKTSGDYDNYRKSVLDALCYKRVLLLGGDSAPYYRGCQHDPECPSEIVDTPYGTPRRVDVAFYVPAAL